MHKGVVLMMKASCRDEAREKADAFMEPFNEQIEGVKHGVWDWYVIGGRWSGTLNPLNKAFDEVARKIVKSKDGFISTDDVDRAQPELQKAWEDLGGKGRNPWGRDQYSEAPDADDILPLSECGTILTDWRQNPVREAAHEMKRYFEIYWKPLDLKKAFRSFKWTLGYYLRCASSILFQRFCFDANLYNTEARNFSVPADKTGWWAVMVDMHS